MAKKRITVEVPETVKVKIIKPFEGQLQAGDKNYYFKVRKQGLQAGKVFEFEVPPFVADWLKAKKVC